MMSIFQLRPSNLKSSGFVIYEASSKQGQYFAYYYKSAYDYAYRQQDLEPQSEYLREPILNTNPGSNYVFFKYCGNFRLADITKKLVEDEVIKILGQLIQAIYELHRCKLMGRCFNIYNILLTNISKGQFCIKLMDFGFGGPLEYQPLDQELNPNNYDYQFDLFLIGRILYFLLTNHDIPQQEKYTQMWDETQQKIENSSYSKNLQKVCKKLICPNQQIRYQFSTFIQDIAKFKNLKLQFQQIQTFYNQDQETLSTINLEIKKRSENSQIMFPIVPPFLPIQTLDNVLIFCFKPEFIKIHKYLNFKLFNLVIINYAIENLKLKFISSDHISVPLSLFVLEKMKCIFLQNLHDMFESKDFQQFDIVEINKLTQSSEFQSCYVLLQNLKYQQRQFMSTYLDNLFKTLQCNYPNYQNHPMYQDVQTFLSIDKFNFNFNEIKNYYRLPLNNLLTKIDVLDEDKSNTQFRLVIFMCILINKIGEINNLNNHFKTIMRSQHLNEIDSPLQVNDFLFKASILELNEQFEELKIYYYS